jgi:hypothetical protein
LIFSAEAKLAIGTIAAASKAVFKDIEYFIAPLLVSLGFPLTQGCADFCVSQNLSGQKLTQIIEIQSLLKIKAEKLTICAI